MPHTRYAARDAARLRNLLLGPQPFLADLGAPLPELNSLYSRQQVLRPVGGLRASLANFGEPSTVTAANELGRWHHRMMQQADLYHFSGPLAAHAWACEEQFGPCRFDDAFPSPYGFCTFGAPIEVPTNNGRLTPICALAWGPVDDCGFTAYCCETYHAEFNPEPKVLRVLPAPTHQWHLRAFTYRTEIPAQVRDEFFHPEIVEEFDMVVNCNPQAPEIDSRGRSDMHSLPRMLRIAFMIAIKRQIGDHTNESVPRGLRKQAERDGAENPNGAINVLSLRPRAERHLYEASQHAGTDGVIRRPAHYTIPCWEVRPYRDPISNEIRKKGTIAYRDPELLSDTPATTVRSGTLPRNAH